jgi:fructose-1,6-bisphosphatase
VAPLAYIVEAAGGRSHDGQGSALDIKITSTDVRSIVSLGSPDEVEKTVWALRNRLPGELPVLAQASPLPYGVG